MLRIATWHAPLSRKGPGLLLRDLQRAEGGELAQIMATIAEVNADVLLLTQIDYDAGRVALETLRDALAERGASYPHLFALRPNTGRETGRDLDGDERLGQPRDAQGFGYFNGQGGMALLSRLAVDREAVQDFSALLWRDLLGSLIAADDPGHDVQRLSSAGHWTVPLIRETGARLTVTAFHATPPVFDGPEDRNGRRNADEVRFWSLYLDGAFGPVPDPLVILGNANLDPAAGDGRRDAVADLLARPQVQDPLPGQTTAYWPDPGPGALRVSYVLPSADLTVTAAGVTDPVGAHRMVWVDLDLPD
ncbi:endonuclease/exonuclease/phosphatase family protein [Thalassococcus profundi]|uniref:Endonuclease/exonuclease/phosphatase family protein n=1 Tax=Thalassococcus profundi TaxID=2282382 RepID=A0A369TV83_9RHOB|nr:endonuclease/exonuclease/phosphatase family protein [Thalassococcus profundi]RDD68077.1 endonuclease/exonuclease/phosphatase family protein [Thalassococcus profundi]